MKKLSALLIGLLSTTAFASGTQPPSTISLQGGCFTDTLKLQFQQQPKKGTTYRVCCDIHNSNTNDVVVATQTFSHGFRVNRFWTIFISNARLTLSPPRAWNVHPGNAKYTVLDVKQEGSRTPVLSFVNITPDNYNKELCVSNCIAKPIN